RSKSGDMSFTEFSAVETPLNDLGPGRVAYNTAFGTRFARRSEKNSNLGWHTLSPDQFPRVPVEFFMDAWVGDVPISPVPEITAGPDSTDEIIYKLRGVLASLHSGGLTKAKE